MLLKRCEYAKAALEPPGIVISDVVLNHPDQILPTGETPPIIAFPLEDAPEPLHRTVINTLAHPGHALGHASRRQLIVKNLGRILETSVAVKQRMCVWILRHGPVKHLIDQSVVVGIPDGGRNNPAVAQIKDSAEIDFVYRRTHVILELGHIRQPFLVGPVGVKLAVQDVLCRMLRVGGGFRAAMAGILDGGFDLQTLADTADPLVVHRGVIITLQIVPDAPVALIRTLSVDFLYHLCNALVLRHAGTDDTRTPAIIPCPG